MDICMFFSFYRFDWIILVLLRLCDLLNSFLLMNIPWRNETVGMIPRSMLIQEDSDWELWQTSSVCLWLISSRVVTVSWNIIHLKKTCHSCHCNKNMPLWLLILLKQTQSHENTSTLDKLQDPADPVPSKDTPRPRQWKARKRMSKVWWMAIEMPV